MMHTLYNYCVLVTENPSSRTKDVHWVRESNLQWAIIYAGSRMVLMCKEITTELNPPISCVRYTVYTIIQWNYENGLAFFHCTFLLKLLFHHFHCKVTNPNPYCACPCSLDMVATMYFCIVDLAVLCCIIYMGRPINYSNNAVVIYSYTVIYSNIAQDHVFPSTIQIEVKQQCDTLDQKYMYLSLWELAQL